MGTWTRKRRERQGMIRLASLDDPLAAVPYPASGASILPRRQGGVTLEVMLPERNAVDRFARRWFGMERRAQVNLDAVGEAFWRLVDGRRSLRQIASELARKFEYATDESRLATLEFAKRLLVRGFLNLQLPGQEGGRAWRAT